VATSEDGRSFSIEPAPVLFPDDDAWRAWEWPGGCEDPRVVESPAGGYVCTYTAFDGKTSRLFVATSTDLLHWEKQGPAFADTPHARRWSKSGSVVTELMNGHLVAAEMDGRFFMYWGEGTCFGATSEDLVRWVPLEFDAGADRYLTYQPSAGGGSWEVHRVRGQRALRPLLFPRRGGFDSLLVEPGPPAVRTRDGVVLIYNGAWLSTGTNREAAPVAYRPGAALFDPGDPATPIARPGEPLEFEGPPDQLEGQVDNVCFAQGLVAFNGTWFLYYGMGDSRIGCATAPIAP
jgi:predicted GH43/DUF377 family glycosyl hydrolase